VSLPPKLTSDQRQEALKKAIQVRRQRAELKQKLKRGELGLEEVLEKRGDKVIGGMRVSALLEALPSVGKVRSRRLIKQIGISPTRRVQGLGPHQREQLLNELG
jgi:hypothetical protein